MITPAVVGAAPPAIGTEAPGNGFAEAIAAALGAMQPTTPPAPTESAETGVDLTIPAPAPHTAVPDQIARLVARIGGDACAESAPSDSDVGQVPVATLAPRPSADPQPPLVDQVPIEAGGGVPTGPETDPLVDIQIEEAIEIEAEDQDRPDAPAHTTQIDPTQIHPTQTETVAQAEQVALAVSNLPTPPAPGEMTPDTASESIPSVGAVAGAAEVPDAGLRADAKVPTVKPTNTTPADRAETNDTLTSADQADVVPSTERDDPASGSSPAVDQRVESNLEPRTDQVSTERIQLHTAARPERSEVIPATTLHRVENAIRHLENAPPPRTITVTVDDQGLHRVTVSLHADGVRLSIPDGASTDTAMIADLERSLESRGFDLSGREQRRRHPQPDEADRFIPTAANAHTSRHQANDGMRI